MAYLNANIPVQYAQIKKEYLYDLKNIMEKLKTALSSVLRHYRRAILFHALWKTVQSFIVYPFGFYSTWL